ncbi:MAG: hypothetical protein COV74_00770 [Candidatus Omnitrophica bacterium CG11_big_fil_rev_8_21_14_0_20_45_26]|uniref:Transporter n=1 Tax=Candidatus Abzuiibacterium crystallinum TaxID=1974748 RepID=A0A2H0LSU4_9BACT|nr:MAG: hypothetical protein COV74_00770 [Candidatus Omnitrophica bacterium CG11_big_fil_rev_8_21_14_0_20_45_26]PIW64855.1 MAG: hypothetical protein COW12_04530 [Candidatus Omnitrophica bacterium CG12_big_fil_rev_8_21_14_0_65_45_16]
MFKKSISPLKPSFLIHLIILLLSVGVLFSEAITYAESMTFVRASQTSQAGTTNADERESAMAAALQNVQAKNGHAAESKKIDLGKRKEAAKVKTDKKEKEARKMDWSWLFFWKKDKKTSPETSQSPAEASAETKAMKPKQKIDWDQFFKKPPPSKDRDIVAQKRRERQAQFPSLDLEQIKASITEAKINQKKEFINAGGHHLQDVLDRAVEVSLPAHIASERIVVAERRIIAAFREFFSEMEFTTVLKDGTLSTGPYKSKSFGLSFTQPLYHGGVIWNTFQLEMANREQAKYELNQTLSEIVKDTSTAYFEYERAWNALKDKQLLFEEVAKLKQMSDEKVKAKLISEIEELNVNSLFGQMEYDLETARQELEIAKLDLQEALQLDIEDPIDIRVSDQIDDIRLANQSSDPAQLPVPGDDSTMSAPGLQVEGKDLDHYIDIAYTYRPDLQVEATKLRASRIEHKIAAGNMLPKADLIIEFGKLGEAFITDPTDDFHLGTGKPPLHKEWRIALEMSWSVLGNNVEYAYDHDQRAPSVSQFLGSQGPITDTYSFTASILSDLNKFAELRETKIAMLEQLVELEKKEHAAIKEVKEAYFNYNKALIQLQASRQRLQYRERLMTLAKHRLDNNEIEISEYLQARKDYTEERNAVHKAFSDFYLAKVNLNYAVGIRDYVKIEPHVFENRTT